MKVCVLLLSSLAVALPAAEPPSTPADAIVENSGHYKYEFNEIVADEYLEFMYSMLLP